MSKQDVEWVPIASYAREEEARLVAGRLRSEGCQARVYPEYQGSYYQGLQAMHRPYDVLVPVHRETDARKILDRTD